MPRLRPLPPSATLFLCLFSAQAGFLVLTPVLPDVAADFGVSTAALGGLRAVYGIAGGVTAIALVRLGRGLSVRDLVAVGLSLIAVGSLLSAAAPNLQVLAFAQIALGAASAILLAGGVAAAAEWAAPEERARVLSWALLGQPASWVLGMPLIGFVSGIHWRLTWLVVPLAASLAALLALRSRPRGEPAPAASSQRSLWSRRGVTAWALGELLAYAAWGGTLTYAGALLLESYDVSHSTVGLLLGIAALALFPGSILARRVVDRRARELLVLLGLGMAVGVALFGAVRLGPVLSATIFASLGMMAGARTLAGSAFGLDAAPEQRVTIMSIRAAAAQFGYLLGAGIGALALASGGYAAVGAALSVLFALAVVPHVVETAQIRARAANAATA